MGMENLRETIEANLRWEFADWIAKHPQAGAFDWNVATTNVLASIGLEDLEAAVKRMAAVHPLTLPSEQDWHRAMLEAALSPPTDNCYGHTGAGGRCTKGTRDCINPRHAEGALSPAEGEG